MSESEVERVKPYLREFEYDQAMAALDLVAHLVNLGDTRREVAFGQTDASITECARGVWTTREDLVAALERKQCE